MSSLYFFQDPPRSRARARAHAHARSYNINTLVSSIPVLPLIRLINPVLVDR